MNNIELKNKVVSAMYLTVKEKGVVAPVDVLMFTGILSKKDYEDWRFGKVLYLEKVCQANLKKLSAVMHEMRVYAQKNNLKASWTFYHQWGKHKDKKLRFSKTDDENIEKWYATHFVNAARCAEIKQEILKSQQMKVTDNEE